MEYYELKYKISPSSKRINRFMIAYSRGKLKSITRKAGTLDLELLAERVPQLEDDIRADDGLVKVERSGKEDSAFFIPAQKTWAEFFEKQTGIKYRFLDGDGRALKSIGKHLIGISGGVEEGLNAWRYMLANWNALDDFYKKNVDLKFINSQLNKILNLMKNGQQTGQTGERNHANDFRRRFHS
ncbi:MAG: hypothetical protein ACOC10_07200 [Bacteroidota bacterium]